MISSPSDGDYLFKKNGLSEHFTLRILLIFSKCYYSTFKTLENFSKSHHTIGRKRGIFYKQSYSKVRLPRNLSKR